MPDSNVSLIKNEKLRRNNMGLFMERFGEELTIDPDEDKKYRAEVAADGELVLYIKNVIPTGDLRLNSIYNPAYEAARWAEKHEFKNRRTTIALMGFSNGAFLKALMNKTRPDTVFFVYEPDEGLFAFLCAFADISDIIVNPRIYLNVTEKQRSAMEDTMVHDMINNRPEAKGITTPFYSGNEEFSKICSTLEIMMDSTRNYQRDRGRNALRCRMYAWNHMGNAHFLLDLKKVVPEDTPVIIVAAGPSLHKNVEVLRRIKGHAFILCTDRALLVLQEYGIVPDATISVDAEKSPDFLRVDIAKELPIICSYQLNVESQKLFYDRRTYYHALQYEEEIIGEKVGIQDGLDQGGNVAGGAFCVCEYLGVKTIILIGQDLAFLDGKHHADRKSDGAPQLDVREIKGIDGSMVQSNDMWIGFRNFFERRIAMNPELRVIDATEGGALIEGTEIMTLSEVADTVCTGDYDMKAIFDSLPTAENDADYERTIDAQNKWIDDLDMISANSREISAICSQLLEICKTGDIRDSVADKKVERMDELRSEIYNTMVNVALEEYWVEDMYSIPDYTFMIRNNEEAASVFEDAISYYDHLPEDCESLKAELKEAMELGKRDRENM